MAIFDSVVQLVGCPRSSHAQRAATPPARCRINDGCRGWKATLLANAGPCDAGGGARLLSVGGFSEKCAVYAAREPPLADFTRGELQDVPSTGAERRRRNDRLVRIFACSGLWRAAEGHIES